MYIVTHTGNAIPHLCAFDFLPFYAKDMCRADAVWFLSSVVTAATICLQASWRGHVVRCYVAKMKSEHLERVFGSALVQTRREAPPSPQEERLTPRELLTPRQYAPKCFGCGARRAVVFCFMCGENLCYVCANHGPKTPAEGEIYPIN